MLTAWDLFLPLHRLWWAACGVPMLLVLHGLVGFLAAWPVTLAIGPFGVAVMVMTLLVRFVLLPVAAYQVSASLRARREAVALQARLRPEIAALRRRFRRRPAEFQQAVQDLLRQHGVGALSGVGSGLRAGILPALLQAPLLIAFYSVILTFAHSGHDLRFLWIGNLALPDPLLLPVIAGLTTYLLTRLTTAVQPPPLLDDEQAAATRRVTTFVYPLALVVSAHFAPAALVLYWVTGNLVGVAQQWTVNRLLLRPAVT